MIEKDIDRIKAALVSRIPFISSLLRKAMIGVTEKPLPFEAPAGVDEKNVIWIYEDKFDKYDLRQKASILAHEIVHIAFLHASRRGEREPVTWNVASDAITNKVLDDLRFPLLSGTIRGYELGIEGWERMSTEELYEKLVPIIAIATQPPKESTEGTHAGISPKGTPRGGSAEASQPLDTQRDLLEGKVEGKVIQRGDPSLYEEGETKEERERKWKEAVASAMLQQKVAGTLPAGVERAFDEILKPRLDIGGLFRHAIQTFRG